MKNLYFFVVLFCLSCSTDPNRPDIPENIEIDVNQDGDTDFEIIYSEIDLEFTFRENDPESQEFDRIIIGGISSKNDNEVLFERINLNKLLPRLTVGDTIKIDSNPFEWVDNYRLSLVNIQRFTDTKDWEPEWSFGFNMEKDEIQYVALKVEKNGLTQLCWLEMSSSSLDGKIEILDTNCVLSGDLIIGE